MHLNWIWPTSHCSNERRTRCQIRLLQVLAIHVLALRRDIYTTLTYAPHISTQRPRVGEGPKMKGLGITSEFAIAVAYKFVRDPGQAGFSVLSTIFSTCFPFQDVIELQWRTLVHCCNPHCRLLELKVHPNLLLNKHGDEPLSRVKTGII